MGRTRFELVTSSVSGKSRAVLGVCYRRIESNGEPLTWANILSRSDCAWGRLIALALIYGSHALWSGQTLTAPGMGSSCYGGPKRYSTVKAEATTTAGCGARNGAGQACRQTPQASRSTLAIALRSAVPADAEFCYQLHEAAMGDYITAIWGWDQQVQRAFHERAFNPHRWQVITAGQADVGMLDVDYRPGEILLVPHRNPPRPPRPRHRRRDYQRASG